MVSIMKCSKCNFENKDGARFCTKCGNTLPQMDKKSSSANSNGSKNIIIVLVVIALILVGSIAFLTFNSTFDSVLGDLNPLSKVSDNVQTGDNENNDSAVDESDDAASNKTTKQIKKSKEWVSIGSYSGSGSGSQTISVPEGKIMVKLSAYPIKNYATNHLYVSGSNGESGGVDWGSKSAVETRSDSFTYTSSSEEIFTIDYYETVSWEVEFFRYQ